MKKIVIGVGFKEFKCTEEVHGFGGTPVFTFYHKPNTNNRIRLEETKKRYKAPKMNDRVVLLHTRRKSYRPATMKNTEKLSNLQNTRGLKITQNNTIIYFLTTQESRFKERIP